MTFANFLTAFLATLTVLGQIICLVLILSILFKKNEKLLNWVGKYGIVFSLIVVFLSLAGSLSYSDILMYEPCKLCWYQRIFMYPQFILLGVGLLRKDNSISFYSLILSFIGLPIALLHYLLQRGLVDFGCSVVGGYSVSCAKYFSLTFGYITIPMMATTAFLMIILFLMLSRRNMIK